MHLHAFLSMFTGCLLTQVLAIVEKRIGIKSSKCLCGVVFVITFVAFKIINL